MNLKYWERLSFHLEGKIAQKYCKKRPWDNHYLTYPYKHMSQLPVIKQASLANRRRRNLDKILFKILLTLYGSCTSMQHLWNPYLVIQKMELEMQVKALRLAPEFREISCKKGCKKQACLWKKSKRGQDYNIQNAMGHTQE